jgi:hypothetical protein
MHILFAISRTAHDHAIGAGIAQTWGVDGPCALKDFDLGHKFLLQNATNRLLTRAAQNGDWMFTGAYRAAVLF